MSCVRSSHRLIAILTISSLFLAGKCFALAECKVNIKEVEPGIIEVSLDNVSAKIESRNDIIKMKIPTAFETHEWTWASTKGGTAIIEGIIEKGGSRGVLSELVAVKDGDKGINWGIFRSDNPFSESSTGKAYFSIRGALYCVYTSASGWKNSVRKVLGEVIAEKATLEAKSADDVYAGLGLS